MNLDATVVSKTQEEKKTSNTKDISVDILSDITVFTKYAKYLPQRKRRETWDEIISRNMGMHLDKYPQLQTEIINAYQYVFDKQVLPSMRSLQFAGRAIVTNNCRLFNCSYAPIDDFFVFAEIMFLLLAGCGVRIFSPDASY
jgi:ribonucleoside-triphosphate reductase